jgi:NRAMP (natural resistance-associated macrophage protein)-like metal ion transporter
MSSRPSAGARKKSGGTAAPGTGAREQVMRRQPNPVKRALLVLGPGVISGAADDDPSGIGTYAIAGASLGFSMLWTMLVTLPMMITTQLMSAKIGIVTGMGLAEVLRRHYPRFLVYPAVLCLVIACSINAGADIGALAAAVTLLVPIPAIWMVVPIAVLIVVFLTWGSYRFISQIFKWLALALFAYIGAAFYAKPHLLDVLRGTFIPTLRFDAQFLSVLVAVLGTTMSPYIWFWQASQEVEEKIAIGQRRFWQRRGTSEKELGYAAWDINVGMVFSQLVAYFIILATAATLHAAGKTDIKSAAQAAEALRPLAGNAARFLFAFGLIGSGMLGVPVLTGTAAYATAEFFGWRTGLGEKPGRARGFYALIAVSTLVGMLINFAGINPIDALFWTGIIFGFLTPPLLVLLMLVSNNRKIMGDHTNGLGLNAIGWITTLIMTGAAIGLIVTWGK